MEKTTAPNTRWWEFYVIRYTMGSVVGACILFLLSKHCKLPKSLQDIVDFGTSKSDEANLIWLILLGITYCYITSGPILVFHAGRFLLRDNSRSLWALFAFSATLPVLMLAAFYGKDGWFLISAYFFLFIVFAQAGVTFLCFSKRELLYEFYNGLSVARASGRTYPERAELVESYRHLKEHGNSFFIVFCEIVFAAGIYFAPDTIGLTRLNYGVLSILLCSWIIPPVFVWLIATLFEREFRDNSEKDTP